MNKTLRFAAATAATVMGAGVGIAGTSSSAHAMDLSVWDRVATCESTNNWSINTGNGYYGGLQFSHSTWIAYGGGAYANNANKATKAQQIAIARRVLAGQGPQAWACAGYAGLTRANGHASATAMPIGSSVTSSVKKTTAKKTTAKKTTVKKSTAKKVTAVKVSSSSKGTYKVKPGDTLSKIAKQQGVKGGWQALWAKNKSTIKNPNAISIGQVIHL